MSVVPARSGLASPAHGPSVRALGRTRLPSARTVEAGASPVTGGCGPTSRFSIYQRHESHRQVPAPIRALGRTRLPSARTVEAGASPVTGGCGPTSRFSIYQRHESHRQVPAPIRALGRTRTCDQEIRRLLLYPLSYEGDTSKLPELPPNGGGPATVRSPPRVEDTISETRMGASA